MKTTHWKTILRSGKKYKCVSYKLGFLGLHIVSLGIKKVDIRFTLNWGW